MPDYTITNITFSLLDIIAVVWFLASWMGYSFFADYRKKSKARTLVKVMYQHRLNWMLEMMKRDNRMVDAKVASNVMGSVTFFASTSMFLLAGLLTLLGRSAEGMALLQTLSFTAVTSTQLWEMKIILLMVIFTYSFFKHTWAIRQFNYSSILIAGAPVIREESPLARRYAERITKILSIAARNFNSGLRGYYFGLAALTWMIHPVLFMICSSWVVVVLFRREIRSRVLKILMSEPFAAEPAI